MCGFSGSSGSSLGCLSPQMNLLSTLYRTWLYIIYNEWCHISFCVAVCDFQNVRCKTRTLSCHPSSVSDLPQWSFDGSWYYTYRMIPTTLCSVGASALALSLTILCLSCIQTPKYTSSSCTFAMTSPPFSSFPHFNHILTALPRPKVMTVMFSWNQSTSIETLSSWSALTSITSVNVFGDQSQHPNVWEKANIDGLMQRKCMGMMCLHVSCNRQHPFVMQHVSWAIIYPGMVALDFWHVPCTYWL